MKELSTIIYSIILALGILTIDFFKFEYICDYPEIGPTFYGFPFVQETNRTWVNSMSGEIYILGFLGNLLLWTLFFRVIFQFFKRFQNKVTFKVIRLLLVVFCLFNVHMYFSIIDWRFSYSHNNFKLNYYQSEPYCKRIFKLYK